MKKIPSAQLRPRAIEPRQPRLQKYTIERGDTLWALARSRGIRVEDIVAANPGRIKDADKIYAGQIIYLPEEGAAAQAKNPVSGDIAKPAASAPAPAPVSSAQAHSQDGVDGHDQAKAVKLAAPYHQKNQDVRIDSDTATGLTGLLKANRQQRASSSAAAADNKAGGGHVAQGQASAAAFAEPKAQTKGSTGSPAPSAAGTNPVKTDPVKSAQTKKAQPKDKPSKPGKLGRALAKAIDKELSKEHSFDKDLQLGQQLTATVAVEQRVIKSDDDEIGDDEHKQATTRRLQAEGKKVAWVEVGGSLDLDAESSAQLGAAEVGFGASSSLSYALLKPLVLGEAGKNKPVKAAQQLLKDQTTELPISAHKARLLPEGSEFSLSGEVGAGLSLGDQKGQLSAKDKRPVDIEVLRLDADKVEVTVTAETDQTFGAKARRSGRGDLALSAERQQNHSEQRTYTLDLSTSAAREAYDALMLGRLGRAQSIAESGGDGVQLEALQRRKVRGDKGKVDGSVQLSVRTHVDGSVGAGKKNDVKVKELSGHRVRVTLKRQQQISGAAHSASSLDDSKTLTLGASASRGRDRVDVFTLDLDKPGAQKALDALKQGDTEPALQLALKGDGAAKLNKSSDQVWTARALKGGLVTQLANGFGMGLSVYQEKISEKDKRVAKNPVRKQMIEDAAQRGQKLSWHGSGGALEPSLSTGLTVGGLGVGFSAGGLLEYHAVTPRGDGHDGVLTPAELPLDARRARELARGSEVVIRGKGQVAVTAKQGQGASVGLGPASVGYSVGVKTEVRSSEEVALRIRKLDGDRVRVVVAERDSQGHDTSLGAEAGLTLDQDRLPGGSALAGLVGDKLANKAKTAVVGQLQKIFSARAELGAGRQKAERDVVSYDLDLSTTAGRQAYDDLLRLNTTTASRMAGEGKGVARVGSLDEKTNTRTGHAEVRVFGLDLYKSKSERRDRLATLINSEGTTVITESEYKKQMKGLLKKGKVEWEAVRVEHKDSGASQRFLHLKLDGLTDKWTSHDELRRTERFVDLMGAQVSDKKIKNDDPSWFGRNINPATHGKTTTSADIYFTEGAMQQIATARPEQAMQAYARAVARLDGEDKLPAWASPDTKVRRQAREILEDYDGFDDDDDDHADDYWSATGSNTLERDYRSYQQAKDFVAYVKRAGAGDQNDRLKAFADLGAKRRFDFHATLGAMNELASDDVILLNKLEMTGREVRLTTASEGGLVHPDSKVSETFD